jgi:hypothetical protein
MITDKEKNKVNVIGTSLTLGYIYMYNIDDTAQWNESKEKEK